MRFGGVQALDRVSLSVEDSEIVSVIGPNGAGKTTLLNAISGFIRPQQGCDRAPGTVHFTPPSRSAGKAWSGTYVPDPPAAFHAERA